MDNAKYGDASHLPELKVIPEGLLKGYVVVHPRWGSFTKEDYLNACKSVWEQAEDQEMTIEAEKGEFDFRGYEVADFKLFDDHQVPAINLYNEYISFNLSCIRKMNCGNYVVCAHAL